MSKAVVRQMLYPAPPYAVPDPPPPPLERVEIEAQEAPISAWWYGPRRNGGPVALMLHGNGENLETMRLAGTFELFAELGVGVLGIDYPGYGRSPGTPSEGANVAAAEAAWEWLLRRSDAGARIVVGWSLGAAVAAQLAARRGSELDGLVLWSAWTDVDSVARRHFPGWLVGLLLDDRYDSLGVAEQIRAPTLIAHGSHDQIIPVEHGRLLHQALPDPKRWLEVPQAGHNDLLARREVWHELDRFLQRLKTEPSSGGEAAR